MTPASVRTVFNSIEPENISFEGKIRGFAFPVAFLRAVRMVNLVNVQMFHAQKVNFERFSQTNENIFNNHKFYVYFDYRRINCDQKLVLGPGQV